MPEFEEYADLEGTGHESREPIKPEDEFYHSVYLAGKTRKTHSIKIIFISLKKLALPLWPKLLPRKLNTKMVNTWSIQSPLHPCSPADPLSTKEVD